MALRNSRQDYGSVARVAHWATALFVLLAWPLGQFRDVFTRGAPRDAGLSVHMALGLGVIILFVLRLVWRALDPPPPPPSGSTQTPPGPNARPCDMQYWRVPGVCDSAMHP